MKKAVQSQATAIRFTTSSEIFEDATKPTEQELDLVAKIAAKKVKLNIALSNSEVAQIHQFLKVHGVVESDVLLSVNQKVSFVTVGRLFYENLLTKVEMSNSYFPLQVLRYLPYCNKLENVKLMISSQANRSLFSLINSLKCKRFEMTTGNGNSLTAWKYAQMLGGLELDTFKFFCCDMKFLATNYTEVKMIEREDLKRLLTNLIRFKPLQETWTEGGYSARRANEAKLFDIVTKTGMTSLDFVKPLTANEFEKAVQVVGRVLNM